MKPKVIEVPRREESRIAKMMMRTKTRIKHEELMEKIMKDQLDFILIKKFI
jgi:hypothetical protein